MTQTARETVNNYDEIRKGYFGKFGGRFIPELLVPALQQLENAFEFVKTDPAFNTELDDLLRNYAQFECVS